MKSNSKKLTYLTTVFLLIYASIFFTQKINLVVADLGRHIKNGEYIVKNFSPELLTTNFYSYTMPTYPFVNHHWATGILFYIVHEHFGFVGLSIANTVVRIIALMLFVITTKRITSNYRLTLFLATFAIPLISTRHEVRPETVSYLFLSVYFFILTSNLYSKKVYRPIFLIPLLQIIWVNTHIFFIFGLLLIGAYIIQELVNKNVVRAKYLITVLVLATIASLLNPSYVRGFLIPFTIFDAYAFPVGENLSIFFMLKNHFNIAYVYFGVVVFMLIQSLLFIHKRGFLKSYLYLILPTLSFIFLSVKYIRFIAMFGFFLIPIGTILLDKVITKNMPSAKGSLEFKLTFVTITVSFLSILAVGSDTQGAYGPGLHANNLASADFFKEQKIEGPIFNNYNIGGYLIYNLYPDQKVFVDNRPEAYSTDFFLKVLEPMQSSQPFWEKTEEKYGFNAIYFHRGDKTTWGQPFLIKRIEDPTWAPVFVDDHTLILLKNNEKNKAVIDKFELPKDTFVVTKNQ